MTPDSLRAGLQECASAIEVGIEEFRARHLAGLSYAPDVPAEALVDTNGRPILAHLYAELAATYRAIGNV